MSSKTSWILETPWYCLRVSGALIGTLLALVALVGWLLIVQLVVDLVA